MKETGASKADQLRLRAEKLLKSNPGDFNADDLSGLSNLAHELAVHQAELELQNEELTHSRLALEEARNRLSTLFEHAPVGYAVVNDSGLIERTNTTLLTMTDLQKEELLDKPFTNILQEEDVPVFLSRFRVIFKNPAEKQLIARLKNRMGAPLHVKIEAKPIDWEEGNPGQPSKTTLLVIITDISDLQEIRREIEVINGDLNGANDRLNHTNRVLRSIRSVYKLGMTQETPEKLIQRACENLTETTGYHSAWIALFEKGPSRETNPGSRRKIAMAATAGFARGFSRLRVLFGRGEYTPCMDKALASHNTVLFSDPYALCPQCPISSEYDGHAALAHCLRFNETTYGVLVVSTQSDFAVERAEQELFHEVADDLAFALHKVETDRLLRDNETYLSRILQTTADGFWVIDTAGRIVEVNQAYCAISGYGRDELLTMGITDLDAREKPEETKERIELIIREGAQVFETEHRKKDGSLLPVEISVTYLDQRGGQFLCFCRDLTQRKRNEESLSLLGRMLDDAPTSITIHDTEGNFIYANAATVSLHGYKNLQDFMKINLHQLDVKESEERLEERFRDIARYGEARFEVRHLRKDGSEFPLEILAKRIDWHGREAVLSIATDITERHEADKALLESQQRLSLAAQSAELGIWDWDIKKDRMVWDAQMFRLYGITEPPSTYGVSIWEEGLHPDDRASAWEECRAALRGEREFNTEFRVRWPDGTVRHLSAQGIVLRDREGNPERMLGVNFDITHRKEAEEEQRKLQAKLNQAQKMESVGRLAGGIAHDFNNMLNVILGYADLSLQQEPDDVLKENLNEIIQAAERSSHLTRQLLAFARRQTVHPTILNLNETIENMLKMLRRLIGEEINLRWIPGESLGTILMDPNQVDQILANLAVNAKDAMEEQGQGEITIETSFSRFDERDCTHKAGFQPGDYILLSFTDNGCGMEKESLENIFEPFYTTKGMGKGTGLGLATIYGIIKQNRGFIDVYSEPGEGTTFRIYLPIREGEVNPNNKFEAVPARGGDETVLIVEDDESILNLIRKVLEPMGYRVISSSNPRKALDLVRKSPCPIDLVITDVIMPDMNGKEMCDELKVLCPRAACLFMSGYPDNVISHQGILDGEVEFIQKPFSPGEISRKIREVLEK